MCDFEEFLFLCGHSEFRRKCYCHQARNHPQHECHRVKKLRNVWEQGRICDGCMEAARKQREAYYAALGYGGGGSQS